ncbi:MAG: RlmE family RNA methyltransferase [Candidatus Thorarchaeota archaeon]
MSDDYYYLKAKYKGYRSRASYKLLEIEQKFNIFQKNHIVLDLGAAPGGWSQVASRKVGKNGKVLAIDKAYISPFKEENIEIINKDIFDKELKDFIAENYGEIDVIISDCSPNISGDYSRDHYTQLYLAKRALDLSQSLLKLEGCFVCKIFQGKELQDFTSKVKEIFETMKLFKPKSSRKKSAEIYIIGLKLKIKLINNNE